MLNWFHYYVSVWTKRLDGFGNFGEGKKITLTHTSNLLDKMKMKIFDTNNSIVMSWWFYFLFDFESVNSILAFLCPFWSCKGNERNFHAWSPYHIFSIASMLSLIFPLYLSRPWSYVYCLKWEKGRVQIGIYICLSCPPTTLSWLPSMILKLKLSKYNSVVLSTKF